MRNKKVVITITSIVALLLVIIGVTYAYWLVTRTQTNENIISTGCLDITLNGEKNDIELTNQFPLSDTDGMKLTPYEFTVTNNCNTSVDYQVNLESIGDYSTAIKASSLKAVIDENTPKRLYEYVGAEPTISGAYESYTLLYGTLAGSSEETEEDTVTYELRIWIDEDAPISEQNKTYRSKISVSVGQHISSEGSTLASLILDDAEENNYLYTTTPDFSKTTSDGEYGLYSAEDDLGTSYYFRGDVENNYVKFGTYSEAPGKSVVLLDDSGKFFESYSTIEECLADEGEGYPPGLGYTCVMSGYEVGDPMYWRIVRINGDGTIRMIYDGFDAYENGVTHTATIGMSEYNLYSVGLQYVGYTYDDGTGKQVDSIIKSVADNWYATNLKENYEQYIADGIFCNDREYILEFYKYVGGFGGNIMVGPTDDWDHFEEYSASHVRFVEKHSPQLICLNKNDRYTKANSSGNSLLEHPIALLTADEALMAGGVVSSMPNTTYYLYTGEDYWTSTMSLFNEGAEPIYFSSVYCVSHETGALFVNDVPADPVEERVGVRPVINLKVDTLFKGSGTIADHMS